MSSVVKGAYKRLQLLLIEDNPGDARLVREALAEAKEDRAFDLDWAEALHVGLVRLAQKQVDLILLDLSLPDAQGLQGIKRFQSEAPDIPIVVLTGTKDERIAIEALQLGAQDYIVKDEMHSSILTRSIRYALERTQERRRFESQLVQAQKMDALGRLAGGIAHDFNNVLSIILGHAELHLQDLPSDSPARDNILPIIKAADRAAALTRQLLAFSRKQIIRPQVLQLGQIVTDTSKMLRRLLGEGIEITVKVEADLGHVRADATQMEQIIMNLAINARDAMPKGGKLLIEAGNAFFAESDAPLHAEVEPGEYVLLTVTDTGTGMDERVRQHLFEPFFTTKDPGAGTGLGLATVYGIVKQSGGQVSVYSEIGRGTSFKIYLPRVFTVQTSSAEARVAIPPRTGAETIVLVEDEENLRRLVEAILKSWGYNVLAAAAGEQALKLCDQHEGNVHLVITDMVLPHMSGRDLVARIRAIRPATQVLYMSGYPGELALPTDILDETTHYLQKPFGSSRLAELLAEIFAAPRHGSY